MSSRYCLPQFISKKVITLLQSGELDVGKLAQMPTSEARHNYLASIVGEDHAVAVNGLFERQLLSKNFWNGAATWVKTITGITPQVRKDLVEKIQAMIKSKGGNLLTPEEEQGFLQDLIHTKLGIGPTIGEAKNITILSNKLSDARTVFEKTGNGKEYGAAQSALERYLSTVKSKGISSWSLNPLKMGSYIAGNMKAIVASMDNSFAGRQGIKTLFTHPVIWSKAFVKSFADLAKGFKNGRNDVIDGVKAEVYSRKNSINGLYDRMKLEIGGAEEAYPGTLGQKIPVFKRLYQASEAAYEGMGIRLRADLADKIAATAQKQGIDLTDSFQAESLGKLINSLTGRGNIGKLNVIGNEINSAFFSIKFFKGNLDVLSLHAGQEMSGFARKEAAKNLAKIITSISGIMVVANQLRPGSVEIDPRSSDFGKIKIGNTRFDITGGMGSLLTLAARLFTNSTKSSITGVVSTLGEKYGSQTRLNVLESFWEGKLSPAFGLIRDVLKGQDYSGNPITAQGLAYNALTPMIAQTGLEAFKDPNSAPIVAALIADGLGISVNTYAPSSANWGVSTGKELMQFKDKIGDTKFKQANDKFNQQFNDWFKNVRNNPKYKNLSSDDKQKAITRKKGEIKDQIFRQYNFQYKT